MRKTRAAGQTCVGDLRLSPLDVGFDVRLHDTPIKLPDAFASVGLDVDGTTYLIEGTRDEMIAAIGEAGYRIDGHADASPSFAAENADYLDRERAGDLDSDLERELDDE